MSKLPFKNEIKRDIICVIVIKLVLLTILWSLFFANPVEKKLNNTTLTQHYTAPERYNS